MSKPTLVVMAAGIGSRYGGIKQIDPVGPSGEILLDYSVYDALRSGFGKIVFIIRREIEEAFRCRVEPTIGRRCEIQYVQQSLDAVPKGFGVPPAREKPWGTAHAVFLCKEVIDGPFAVINADDFYGRTSFRSLRGYLDGAQDRDGAFSISIIGYRLKNTLTEYGHVSRGVCTVTSDGHLLNIKEQKRVKLFGSAIKYAEDDGSWTKIPGETIVSMNMWGFTPSILGELEARFARFLRAHAGDIETAEYLLPDVVGELVREKKAFVRVLPTHERWFGVTYPKDKATAQQAIGELTRRGVYPEDLWGT
ncbi:TPA: nucleotidyltransferase [Candidatus Acetothermia bacterium]|nr:nucleotidyltransferase [Candidatus Acetothermia bacterium]